MNLALIAALGLTGLSTAVIARRILAAKRRRHQEWQRAGGFIPQQAEAAPEKQQGGEEEQMSLQEAIRCVQLEECDPPAILAAGGTLEDVNRAVYGEGGGEMQGLYGVGNYELTPRRF